MRFTVEALIAKVAEVQTRAERCECYWVSGRAAPCEAVANPSNGARLRDRRVPSRSSPVLQSVRGEPAHPILHRPGGAGLAAEIATALEQGIEKAAEGAAEEVLEEAVQVAAAVVL